MTQYQHHYQTNDITNIQVLIAQYGGTISSCSFHHVSFENATLENVVFTDCQFIGCDFSNAQCNHSSFHRCDFFVDDQVCQFTKTSLIGTKFEHCNLSGCLIRSTIAYRLSLSHCTLTGSVWKDIAFNEPESTQSQSRWECCTGQSIEFSDFSIEAATFVECDLASCDSQNVRFNHCRFVGGNLNITSSAPISFLGSDLRETNLIGTKSEYVDFTGAFLNAFQAQRLGVTEQVKVC
ncbi:hypothetical protein F9817_01325 [Vibrio sp. CAIM 722]|uniref:Pentapeptide repeat-containing protein n=1 Tax=Vibrio eleionomae TaxID=2653505 RepID=A0A7X4LHP3_9VIBR|nr:pentapeptide repeat-containing protein [Vibrio eleionomae]MZI91846.1 hypothetical protein [Vibrio eleionomae]